MTDMTPGHGGRIAEPAARQLVLPRWSLSWGPVLIAGCLATVVWVLLAAIRPDRGTDPSMHSILTVAQWGVYGVFVLVLGVIVASGRRSNELERRALHARFEADGYVASQHGLGVNYRPVAGVPGRQELVVLSLPGQAPEHLERLLDALRTRVSAPGDGDAVIDRLSEAATSGATVWDVMPELMAQNYLTWRRAEEFVAVLPPSDGWETPEFLPVR